MSGGGRSVAAIGGVLAALAAAAMAALLLLGGRRAAMAPPLPPQRPRPAAAAKAGPHASRAAPATPEGPGAVEARTETALEGGDDLARAIAGAALGHVGREGAIREALRAARAGEIDAVDLGLRLHDSVGGRPDLAAPLVPELCSETRADLALKIAQTLAEVMDDAELRAATVGALAAADPAARAAGLLALLGRGEPEAVGLAARSFCDDAPEARATAGFLLNEAPGEVPAEHRDRILEAARAALRDRSTPPRVREEAAGLLGRAGSPGGPDDADLDLLARTLQDGPEPGVRGRALRALVESGAPERRVRPALERALADPAMPPEIGDAIRAWLGRRG